MKLIEAKAIMAGKRPAFRVRIESYDKPGIVLTEYFPESSEPPIESIAEAYDLAERFARATVGLYFNIYVINEDFTPLPNSHIFNAREL